MYTVSEAPEKHSNLNFRATLWPNLLAWLVTDIKDMGSIPAQLRPQTKSTHINTLRHTNTHTHTHTHKHTHKHTHICTQINMEILQQGLDN